MSDKSAAKWPETMPSGKGKSDFFAAVRQRGMNNALLDEPGQAYEREHPGMKCKWEYLPPNGDNSLVIAREMQGYKIVDAGEFTGTESSQKSGPIKRGDLVLMAAPEEVHQAILDADARAAIEDLRAPETAYRDALDQKKVNTSSGPQTAKPVGQIVRSSEILRTQLGTNEDA